MKKLEENEVWELLNEAKELENVDKRQRRIKEYTAIHDICDCNSPLDYDVVNEGYIVCISCGSVQEKCMDTSAEWRCFQTQNGRDTSGIRCGDSASILLPGTQLNVYVSGDKKLQRVQQWNNLTSKERTIHQIQKDFDAIGDAYGLTKAIVNTATEYYNKLYMEMEKRNFGIKRCNVRQGLKAACLYYACRKMNIPREKKEIAEMLGNSTKIVTKGCNQFLDIMGDEFILIEPFKPKDFVIRFSQIMNIPFKFQIKLEKVVDFVSIIEIFSDSNPISITSTCLYFLSLYYELGISKYEIHEKCGTSQVIVTRTYNKMLQYEKQIIDAIEH